MTFHLHIQGLVQGVGFRPLIYRLATAKGYKGFACNGNDGVHIEINATGKEAADFLQEILNNRPPLAAIHHHSIRETAEKKFSSFEIIESTAAGKPLIPLTPDYALCDDCRKEMNDHNNRRYQYPFITCTTCGPRYSITRAMPYDRKNTTMNAFTMCDECNKEYNSPADRRYYAQTSSCETCGIMLSLYDGKKQLIAKGNKESLEETIALLQQGNIIAVKGIGGYLLMTDATNEKTIEILRQRKHRPHKPFAVLFSSVEDAKRYCHIIEEETGWLQSPQSPIILAKVKEEAKGLLPLQAIAPGLNPLGIMVPYAPLLELLSKQLGKPLIATSANISGSPIIYDDEDALNNLAGVADYILSHNREILLPQDDSVIRLACISKQPVIIRRARGLSPSYFDYTTQTNKTILATGALMKSSFAISSNHAVYISQYLGSTESYEAQQAYQHTLQHLQNILQVTPQIIVTDKHPQYFSHELANEIASQRNIEVKYVQHHKAHFAAVLAENDLLQTENVLGVIWDGTGLGNDGNMWGGEFFKYAGNEMLRCYYFDYFPVIAGDKTAQEPRIAALCATTGVWPVYDAIKEKFTVVEWKNYQSLIQSANIHTSSVGRIFDAVASLLNICDKQTYEGEAAMLLQALAEEYVQKHGHSMDRSYFTEGSHYYRIPTATFLQRITEDIKKEKNKNYIAAKFHYSLVHLVDLIAQNTATKKLCFSGGVFQNILLVDMLQYHLSGKYDLYFHKQLSPNDESISFGQLVYADNEIDKVIYQ